MKGYTLVEVLIAMTIFAIVGVLVATGMHSILQHYSYNRQLLKELSAQVLAQALIDRDLHQLVSLPSSTELHSFEFIKQNVESDLQHRQGSFTQVAYQLQDQILYRQSRNLLKPALSQTVILTSVKDFQVRFLNKNGEYSPIWPSSKADKLPKAIQLSIDLGKAGQIRRVYAPGVADES